MDVEKIKNKIKNWPQEDADEYLKRAVAVKTIDKRKEISEDFLAFVKHMWPGFVEGRHHTEIAEKFNKIAKGRLKRLIINMPPRHTKSEFASNFLPAWMVGKVPQLKIIQTTHTTELAIYGSVEKQKD